jgi:hypothetical protein
MPLLRPKTIAHKECYLGTFMKKNLLVVYAENKLSADYEQRWA